MSVYTSVSDEEMRAFLTQYDLGGFVSLQGIAQGITNSNYFLTTTTGRYVLTVFEVLKQEELPFFLELSRHLSSNGVACPAPIVRKDGKLDSVLVGKPEWLGYRLGNGNAMLQYRGHVGKNAYCRTKFPAKNGQSALRPLVARCLQSAFAGIE